MSLAAHMNGYEACFTCGGPVISGMPCSACNSSAPPQPPLHDLTPQIDMVPERIEIPRSIRHAEMMLLVAERYLADHGRAATSKERE